MLKSIMLINYLYTITIYLYYIHSTLYRMEINYFRKLLIKLLIHFDTQQYLSINYVRLFELYLVIIIQKKLLLYY